MIKDYWHDTIYTDKSILTLCFVCHKLYDMKNDNEYKKHQEHQLNYIIGQSNKMVEEQSKYRDDKDNSMLGYLI